MTPEEYRRLQVAFVSGHGGSNELEILFITGWIPCVMILYNCVLSPWINKRNLVTRFFTEFAIICVPQVLLFCYPSYGFPALMTTLVLSLVGYILKVGPRSILNGNTAPKDPKMAFLTNTRATIMVMVMIAILAVDYPVFPRRLAKTETFGTSLMDVGVGCVVASFGLVAARHYSSGKPTSFLTTMKSTLPLLILGVARMAFVKGINYQEHLSEYGVHWNFFMTLGCLPPLLTLCFKMVPVTFAFNLGLILLTIYQGVLSSNGLDAYLLSEVRTDFLSMNKEGIFSLIGYLALSLINLGCGLRIMRYPGNKDETRASLFMFLMKRVILLTALYGGWRWIGVPVSRRMCNLPFVLWTAAKTIVLAAVFLLPELIESHPPPLILESLSKNQLFAFLLANLLTGAINMTSHTILTPDWKALLIINGYMLTVTMVCVVLLKHNISLKL